MYQPAHSVYAKIHCLEKRLEIIFSAPLNNQKEKRCQKGVLFQPFCSGLDVSKGLGQRCVRNTRRTT